MRIRLPFAGVFFLLCLITGYAGLSSLQLGDYVNDKALHVFTFFLLTIAFYWIVDTNRRRTLHLTLVTCTLVLGVGSEFLQGFLPNGRNFDVYDIVANAVGSLAGLGLCSWYHRRMLERRRTARGYTTVPGGEADDVELGEGVDGNGSGAEGQEEGVMNGDGGGGGGGGGRATRTLEEEVDNWDENALGQWDEADDGDGEIGALSASKRTKLGDGADVDGKRRVD